MRGVEPIGVHIFRAGTQSIYLTTQRTVWKCDNRLQPISIYLPFLLAVKTY